MDIKEIDSMNALASGLKEQMEAVIYILSNPSTVKKKNGENITKEEFVITLRKVMDFLADEGTRDLVSQISLLIQNSENLKVEDLYKFNRQWNYIINQTQIQADYVISERLGLKFASLSFKKGKKSKTLPIDLKKYAGIK